uniref:serine/arginine repetitive matrix protein 3-like n=1 Tax=Halichoerus grypus TaxID=9711 RepID=UPI0016590BB6|nr:serine/arginine repetitive matrix protein 3-like [Halichoerus grypus]
MAVRVCPWVPVHALVVEEHPPPSGTAAGRAGGRAGGRGRGGERERREAADTAGPGSATRWRRGGLGALIPTLQLLAPPEPGRRHLPPQPLEASSPTFTRSVLCQPPEQGRPSPEAFSASLPHLSSEPAAGEGRLRLRRRPGKPVPGPPRLAPRPGPWHCEPAREPRSARGAPGPLPAPCARGSEA